VQHLHKNKPYMSCKIRASHKYSGTRLAASSVIFELVKKVRLAGTFLDKKYTKDTIVC
jgi:hypothetical protein